MIYEIRTYNLKPGTVPEFEATFGEALVEREKITRIGAFWHTELGPLNQVIHVWPYEDLEHRGQARAAAYATKQWPASVFHLMLSRENEIVLPAPFMRELTPARHGIYEMCVDILGTWATPTVLDRWAEVIAERERLSPLVACWYGDIGSQNRFIHVWGYRDLDERARIHREAQKLASWPPDTGEFIVFQETKILVPASFSPLQ